MSPAKIPVAVLGASGYIGQHFTRLLADHPEFEPVLLGSGERSEGKRLADVWQLAEAPPSSLEGELLRPLTPAILVRAGVRVVFSALPSGTAGRVESAIARRGISVFTNAADHRMDPAVPLLVPEVNADHLALSDRRPKREGLLVANPNCSATGLVVALAPLIGLLRPRSLHVSTYQSLSGAGYPGVPSLAITDNVVPFIREEEEKVAAESARILGTRRGGEVVGLTVPFLVHCARVATREGHLESVTIEATRAPSRGVIERALRSFDPLGDRALPTAPHPPIELRREADRPQPIRDRWAGAPARARGMAVVVGRIRWEPPFLRLFLLSHNAVRGGAGASVLNAELARADGYLDADGRRSR
ncbi:MAG TPA: aspartate-semialdehyde dehydrogenase [Thermoplasmata archaeon]|nr:aspartate-semialdehyde dehydrogenase [Thermoplasmata archaeon]